MKKDTNQKTQKKVEIKDLKARKEVKGGQGLRRGQHKHIC